MKILIAPLYILLLLPMALIAQNDVGRVTGFLKDSATHVPVDVATIAVFAVADSSVVNFGLTDKDGGFELSRLPLNLDLRLLVSHVLYGKSTYDFILTETNPVKDFDTLFLAEGVMHLKAAEIVWEQPPITVRNDTLEFNAASFKTRPGSMVEELLKRLPGVEVNRDGQIIANGKVVTKIMLDGKDFFGSDPVTVMKNLPSMIIDKVQITDEKDDFGEVTEENNAVINLTVRAGSKKGQFGKVFGGYGTDQRYEGGLLWNFFRDTTQISIIGYANNLSEASFSMTDLTQLGGFDRGQRIFYSYDDGSYGINGFRLGGGRGVTESSGGGINVNHDLPKKLSLNLSYFIGYSNSQFEMQSDRENYLADSTLMTSQYTLANPTSLNHNGQAQIVWTPDTINRFEIRPNLRLSTGIEDHITDTRNSYLQSTDTNVVRNSYNDEDNSWSGSIRAIYRRRVKEKYSFSFSSFASRYEAEADGTNLIEEGLLAFPLGFDEQFQTRTNTSRRLGTTNSIYFSKDLKKDWEAGVRASHEWSTNDRRIFTLGYDSITDENPVLLEQFSTDFTEDRNEMKLTPFVGKKFGDWQVQLQPELRSQTLHTAIQNSDSSGIHREKTFFNPGLQVHRRGAGFYFRANYDYNYRFPRSNELIGAADNRNPNYLRLGNPSLAGYFIHSFNMYLNKTTKSKISLYFSANLGLNQGDIISSTRYTSEGVQILSYVNTEKKGQNGYTYGNIRKSFKIKKEWELIPVISFNASFNNGYRSINQRVLSSQNYNLRPGLSLGIVNPDKIDLRLAYNRVTAFSQTAEVTTGFNSSSRHSAQADAWVAITKRWWFESKLSVVYQPLHDAAFSLEDSYKLWSLSITRTFFKNNQAQLRLSVYDVLLQNRNLEQEVGPNYVEYSSNNAVTRYAMLSFVYNLHKFKTTGRTKRGFEFW
ncbi:MAG: hypothetical protein WD077_16160 [Bacteroidia bacterium]